MFWKNNIKDYKAKQQPSALQSAGRKMLGAKYNSEPISQSLTNYCSSAADMTTASGVPHADVDLGICVSESLASLEPDNRSASRSPLAMAGHLAVQNQPQIAEARSSSNLGVLSEASSEQAHVGPPDKLVPATARAQRPHNICAQLVTRLLRKDQSLRGECKILDVGCGEGQVAVALRQEGFRKIFGADCRADLLEEAQR